MKLNDVNKCNENYVWNILFGHRYSEYPLPKYTVDDVVRISKYKSNFTQELFEKTKVI